MRHAAAIGLGAATLAALTAPDAHAIVIRDDVPDAAYLVDDADYPALVDLFGPGDCIGTLVQQSHLLTVAHCAMDLSPGQTLPVAGIDRAIAEVILHPQWQDVDNFDIALIRFEDPVTDVEPLPIYRGTDELGATVEMVGRGVTATGLVGEAGAVDDGSLRRATNVVSGVEEHFIEITFEPPADPAVLDLEGVGAAGDSGCPVSLEVDGVRYIAGLNSFGEGPAGVGVAQYTSWDYQTRVSTYLDWLDETVGTWPSDPGPGDGDTGSDGGDDDDDDVADDSGDAGANDTDGAGDDPAGTDGGGTGSGGADGGGGDDGGCTVAGPTRDRAWWPGLLALLWLRRHPTARRGRSHRSSGNPDQAIGLIPRLRACRVHLPTLRRRRPSTRTPGPPRASSPAPRRSWRARRPVGTRR